MTQLPRNIVAWILTLAVTGLAADARACSICHGSDPLFDTVGPEYAANPGWSFALDWERYDKEQRSAVAAVTPPAPGVSFHGGHEHAAGEVETLVENRLIATFTRSLGPRFTGVVRVPWSTRRMELQTGGPDVETANSDLSDPELLAVLRVWPAPSRGLSGISVLGGAKTGWGENDRREGDARLDEHLQSGTGSVDWILGASGVVATGRLGTFFGSAMLRRTGANDTGYEYGDIVLANAGVERAVRGRFLAALSLNLRDSGTDRQDSVALNDTGGMLLCVTPRAIVALGARASARLSIQLPLFSDLHGSQSEEPIVAAGLTRRF